MLRRNIGLMFLNYDDYPLKSTPFTVNQLVHTARLSLTDWGFCALPNILSPDALRLVQDEAYGLVERRRNDLFRYEEYHDVYLGPGGDLKTSRTVAPGDMIPVNSVLKQMHSCPLLTNFLEKIIGKKLVPSPDPLGGVSIDYYFPGDGLAWRFDNRQKYLVHLLIMDPDRSNLYNGGSFEYANTPDMTDARTPYMEGKIRKLVTDHYQIRESRVRYLDPLLPTGTLWVFRASQYCHRISPVRRIKIMEGNEDDIPARIEAVFYYGEDLVDQKKNFGRTAS